MCGGVAISLWSLLAKDSAIFVKFLRGGYVYKKMMMMMVMGLVEDEALYSQFELLRILSRTGRQKQVWRMRDTMEKLL